MTDLFDQDALVGLDVDDLPLTMPIEEVCPSTAPVALNFTFAVEMRRQLNDEAQAFPSPTQRLCDVWALIRYSAARIEPQDRSVLTLDQLAWFAVTLDEIGSRDPVSDWWEIPMIRRMMAYQNFTTRAFDGPIGLGPVDRLACIEGKVLDELSALPGTLRAKADSPALLAALERNQDPFERIA